MSPEQVARREWQEMEVHGGNKEHANRTALIRTAVGGLCAGVGRAIAGWLISLLTGGH